MDIFVYSDESGVFDKSSGKYFVFAGIIFLNKHDKDVCARKYARAEKTIYTSKNIPEEKELKATYLDNGSKSKLYRSLNNVYKFGVVVKLDKILASIFREKKSKQRYQDFAYKSSL